MVAIPPGRLSVIVSTLIWLMAAAVPAHAQTFSDLTLPSTVVADAGVVFAPVVAANRIGGADDALPGSSRALTSLQVSFVALEALDVFSTMRGLRPRRFCSSGRWPGRTAWRPSP
jgi:hypothetical protein